ncbi:MAG: hypothetical protein ACXABY_17290, partial [Candidatus Thorarchaeota archaeon]
MKYAYSHLYNINVPLSKTSMLWEQMVDRALKSMAREKLRLGRISLERSLLLWQVYTRGTVVEQKPKLNSVGRHIITEFRTWLESITIDGVSIPRAIPIQLRDREVLEIHTVADIAYHDDALGLGDDKQKYLRIASLPTIIENAILAEDSGAWCTFHPLRKSWTFVHKKEWMVPVLQQISRSMFRNITWPNPDGRCNRCPYSGICSYEDVGATKEE